MLFGIIMLFSPQPSKELSPIIFKLLGNDILVKFTHPLNVFSISITPSGTITDSNFVDLNAPPKYSTELGMKTEVIGHNEKTLSSSLLIPLGIVIDVTLVQPSKAPSPISVTLFGKSIEVIVSHPAKALFPIFFSPSWNFNSLISLQSANASQSISSSPFPKVKFVIFGQ